MNVFRFGNFGIIRSEKVVKLPLRFGDRRVDVHIAVLPKAGSHTPLLLSKEFLTWIGAVVDISSNHMYCKALKYRMRLIETERDHYSIPVLPEKWSQPEQAAVEGSIS